MTSQRVIGGKDNGKGTYELTEETASQPRNKSNMNASERPSFTRVSINKLFRGLEEQRLLAMICATN